MNKRQKLSFILPFILILLVFASFVFACFGTNYINEYENRGAKKLPKFVVSEFFDGSFQSKTDEGLADQLPFAESMKRIYNNVTSRITEFGINACVKYLGAANSWNQSRGITSDLINQYLDKEIPKYSNPNLAEEHLPPNMHDNRFYSLSELVSIFNGHLVVPTIQVEDNREDSSLARVVNSVAEREDVQSYFYCVERERDIDLITGEKNENRNKIADVLRVSPFHKGCFSVDNFEMFDDLFWKTDHHLNNKGAYIAYCQILKMLGIDDEPLYPVSEWTLGDGQGSRALGAGQYYTEYWRVYEYNLPKLTYLVNGDPWDDCGMENYYIEQSQLGTRLSGLSYHLIYGYDYAELIIDNPDKTGRGNILAIGDSYDNAILKLLASHYDKLYSIDLRKYEEELGIEFDINKYIDEHDITTLIVTCSTEYSDEFEI